VKAIRLVTFTREKMGCEAGLALSRGEAVGSRTPHASHAASGLALLRDPCAGRFLAAPWRT
jgi:hypothetical protein